MSVKTITDDIKKGSFKRLYYIYGDEEYLKRHYYSEIINKAADALPEFNVIEFEGKGFDFTDFCNSVNGYPAMAQRKAVGVIDIDNSLFKKSFLTEFTRALEQIPEFCTVVFLDTEMKAGLSNAALLKAVESCGGVAAKVGHPSAAGLLSWTARHFKSEGKTVSEEDIRYMLEIADTDMRSLKNEISKLCSSVKGERIERRDIDALVTRSIEANRFEIADAFCAGNYNKMNIIIDRLYRQNTDDIMISNVFYRMFIDLWHAGIALDSGKTQSDMVRDFGMRPYAALKALKNVKGMSLPFLRECVLLSLKLDRELKSMPFNKRGLITVFVADVISRRQSEKTAY